MAARFERREERDPRVSRLFEERYAKLAIRNDRLLIRLQVAQWVIATLAALWISPLAWEGKSSSVHGHVFAALLLGGAITSMPLVMAKLQPGAQATRYVIAAAQVLWSALLIHLSGGRIETHFHVFASLAILAFYRDLKILIPATVVVAIDHFARGIYWPESVYGVANPEWWRFLEHAGWVIFLDAFLIYNCVQSHRELWVHCDQQVKLEDATEAAAASEKLAAVGQLAASVGHELRNPLAAIRNAHTFIGKKLEKEGLSDPKVHQFMGLISRELDASAKIIGNLLDFSRPKPASRAPCPLRPLVDEVVGLVPPRKGVNLTNEVPADLPVLDLDKDQMRQVLINLMQNASEAFPESSGGTVTVRGATRDKTVTLEVVDDGPGIPEEVLPKIFNPLFSTKIKGTGLGLAVVQSMVERHDGKLTVESGAGSGTRFVITLGEAA